MYPVKVCAALCLASCFSAALPAAQAGAPVKVRMTWGHGLVSPASFYIKLVPGGGASIDSATPVLLEPGEGASGGAWQSRAGAGDVDGLEFTIAGESATPPARDIHITWADLLGGADSFTARRLSRDPAFRVDPPRVTVQMDRQGTAGFTVTAAQLRAEGAMWIPSVGVYLAAGDSPLPWDGHMQVLAPWKGQRILDRVAHEPEATYARYTTLWEDMGSPSYVHPNDHEPGHIVTLSWDSAIPKFGIDRGAGVRNDLGNPDRFQFWFDFADVRQGLSGTWKSQSLADGLPVITTVLEREGVRFEVEQFAYPLDGPPASRRGDIGMVLLQKVRLSGINGQPRRVPVRLIHRRLLPPYAKTGIEAEPRGGALVFREGGFGRALLSIEAGGAEISWTGTRDYQREQKRIDAIVYIDLPAGAAREFVVKLPSPAVEPAAIDRLNALGFADCRDRTLAFWSDYIARGARFSVPEKAVTDMFRAAMWHALRLPRRHGGEGPGVSMDLPYSNFAYSQTGTPWPINQAVYVDYMIHDLRGYHAIAAEELAAQFRNNQERDGHVNGFANWVSYTPAMLYAVAQNFLLSGDRAAFEGLLPQSLNAMDWCLGRLRESERREGVSRGLVTGPLNDATGEGAWAFNQAYMAAGLDLFGRALGEIGHARAAEARTAARALREAVDRAFRAASMRSPLIQLRDGTWIPYVPSEAGASRRLLDEWYPADVDTGAVHMIRLGAVAPNGPLAGSLLNDHEDNLYWKGYGAANEPVYNPQATAYLLRDEPLAAIRAFYSTMASGFSHSVFEPVEHRWTHGQYFGPPSNDGAWFELYRNMLIRERDDGALFLCQATPRPWLADGKTIEVRRAPTYFGPMAFTVESRAAAGEIRAEIEMPARSRPRALLLRLRHPEAKPLRGATVNGAEWKDFDSAQEWIRIDRPEARVYTVSARY